MDSSEMSASGAAEKPTANVPLLLIIGVFFASMLPLAATRVIDTMNFERYYTDAAVSMLHTGDYLTPQQGDGAIRLHKPMLTYWLLVISYKIGGVSVFTSHLPFLLAGCAAIALTYQLALTLTADARSASMAALIIASNLLFICVAVRAVQDVLLAFALLLSAYGFIRLICLNKTDTADYWWAYGGAALGIAVKGLLPLLFVSYALIFACFILPRQELWRRLINIPAVLVGIIIACLPSALLAWKHGFGAVWQSFWSDQVSGKTSLSGSFPRIGGYLLVYLVCFAPWFIGVGSLIWRGAKSLRLPNEQQLTCVFILLWAALLALVFGFGDKVHNRYLVPAVPLLSIVFALVLRARPEASARKIFRALLDVAAIAFVVLAAFGLAVLAQSHLLMTHYAGLTIFGLAGAMITLRFGYSRIGAPAAVAMSTFVLLLLCFSVLSPFTLPDQTGQVAESLKRLQIDRNAPVLVGNDKLCSRLRLSTRDAYDIRRRKGSELPSTPNSLCILTEGEARRAATGSTDLQIVAAYPSRLSTHRLITAVLRGDSKAYIDSCRVHCYLAQVR